MTQTIATVLPTISTSKTIHHQTSTPTNTTTIGIKTTPHIAVTPSLSMEREEQEKLLLNTATNRRSRALSPSRRRDLRKISPCLQQEIEPVHARRLEFEPPFIGRLFT